MNEKALSWKLTRLIEVPDFPDGAEAQPIWKGKTPATFGQLIASKLLNTQTNSTEAAGNIVFLADRIMRSKHSTIIVDEQEVHVLNLVLKSLKFPNWLKSQLNENLLVQEVETKKAPIKKKVKAKDGKSTR